MPLGLIDRFFERDRDEGREKVFGRAQIPYLINNGTGQRAWQRNGFEIRARQTNATFEKQVGPPGANLLAQTWD